MEANAKRRAVYPGTFDPITNGHQDLVRRAASMFDHVIIGIAANPNKAPLFPLEIRVDLARRVVSELGNVEVMGYSGLTVDFARQQNCSFVIRGLRAVSDFEYELQMAQMNRELWSEVETLFLAPELDFSFLSSSLVREIAGLGGDMGRFVSPPVLARLKAKLGG